MKIIKISQREKLPFNIIKIEGGKADIKISKGGIPIIIYAFTAEQARYLALRQYPQLKSYVDGCESRHQECDISARLDKEKLEEIQKYREKLIRDKANKEKDAWYIKESR